jgi:hypothetical protein
MIDTVTAARLLANVKHLTATWLVKTSEYWQIISPETRLDSPGDYTCGGPHTAPRSSYATHSWHRVHVLRCSRNLSVTLQIGRFASLAVRSCDACHTRRRPPDANRAADDIKSRGPAADRDLLSVGPITA